VDSFFMYEILLSEASNKKYIRNSRFFFGRGHVR